MKKKYIIPNTEVISVKTQQMIALSMTDNPATQGGEVLSREIDDVSFDFSDDSFDFSEEEFGF